jgi:hypothetical protein
VFLPAEGLPHFASDEVTRAAILLLMEELALHDAANPPLCTEIRA